MTFPSYITSSFFFHASPYTRRFTIAMIRMVMPLCMCSYEVGVALFLLLCWAILYHTLRFDLVLRMMNQL